MARRGSFFLKPHVTNGRRGPLDRLSAADIMALLPDDTGLPLDIGAIGILESAPLLDRDGHVDIDALRAKIGLRLHRVPRFRQALYRPPRGLGWPLWVDAQRVDLDHHVRVAAVPSPGTQTELLATCESLRRRPFDTERPLWEMWFLTGLADGNVGLFIKVHHAIADGVAGVATLASFVDVDPDAPADLDEHPWAPAPKPTVRQLLTDNIRRRGREVVGALSKLRRPQRIVQAIRDGWPAMRETFGEGRAPRTSLGRRLGKDRKLAVLSSSLDDVKAVAHAHDAKVNDVLMTLIANGLRELLVERGEPTDAVVLRAFVPVSLHDPAGRAEGNIDGAMILPLPIGVRDPFVALERIAAESAERKKKARPPAGSIFRFIFLQRMFLRYAPHQRLMNFYAANVPGPAFPVYLAGARVLELFPVVPLSANLSIGVGALSYDGRLNITIVGDRDACPDLDVFVRGMRHALTVLTAGRIDNTAHGLRAS